jgi:hypothetical protein
MDRLPEEAKVLPLDYLPPCSLIAFGLTCKWALRVSFSDYLWLRHCAYLQDGTAQMKEKAEGFLGEECSYFRAWLLYDKGRRGLSQDLWPQGKFWNPLRGTEKPPCFWPLENPDDYEEADAWNLYLNTDCSLKPDQFIFTDKCVCIVDKNSQILHTLETGTDNPISSLCITDRFMAVGTIDEPCPTPKLVVFFSEDTSSKFRPVELVGHASSIFDLKWIPQSELLLSCGSIDTSIRSWDVTNATEMQKIYAPTRTCIVSLYTPYVNEPHVIFSISDSFFDEWDLRTKNSEAVNTISGVSWAQATFLPKEDNNSFILLDTDSVCIYDRRNFQAPVGTFDSGCSQDNLPRSVLFYKNHFLLHTEEEFRIFDSEYRLLETLPFRSSPTHAQIEHGKCFFIQNEFELSYFDLDEVISGNPPNIFSFHESHSCPSEDCWIEGFQVSPFGLVAFDACGVFTRWNFF